MSANSSSGSLHQTARDLAIAALSTIAADAQMLDRFLDLTGYRAEDIRLAAKEPEFLVGVLHFAAEHEPVLLAAAATVGVEPGMVRNIMAESNII